MSGIEEENNRLAREFMRLREEGVTFDQALFFTKWWREQLNNMLNDMMRQAALPIRNKALEDAAVIADIYEPRCDACPSGAGAAIRALKEDR